jgi:phosphohistidine phosphatase SixA
LQHLVVRHAHAGQRGSTDSDDLLRALTDDGKAEAHALVELHADTKITAVWSSRAVRCVETVAPLAAALGLDVRTTPHLLDDADPAQMLRWLVSLDGPTVMCSHGELIGGLISRLQAQGILFDGPAAWPKASTWELNIARGTVTRARFVSRPAV